MFFCDVFGNCVFLLPMSTFCGGLCPFIHSGPRFPKLASWFCFNVFWQLLDFCYKKQMANDPEGYPRLFRVKVHPENTKFLKYTGQSETGRLIVSTRWAVLKTCSPTARLQVLCELCAYFPAVKARSYVWRRSCGSVFILCGPSDGHDDYKRRRQVCYGSVWHFHG